MRNVIFISAITVTSLFVLGSLILGGYDAYVGYRDYQLQNPIFLELKKADSQQLKRISADNRTAAYLLHHQVKSVSADALDSQGWQQYGYYTGKINGHNVMINATTVKESDWHPVYRLTKITLD